MFVWMLVQDDELELPVAVADSLALLCRRMGLNRATVASEATRGLPVYCRPWPAQKVRCKAVKVQVDDDEW